MKIIFVFLAIHALVGAEPAGLREETGAGVFPEGKREMKALVDEVLMEVETQSQDSNNNPNNFKDTRGVNRKRAEAVVSELDQGALDFFTRVNSDIPPINLWAFAGIITFLLAFTVLFEQFKEKIIETTRGSSKETIVTSIFSELTVLGFLAMICFLLTQFGLSHLSLIVFGSPIEPAEHEENQAKLGEMLESIHMVIFLVMVIFILEAAGIILISDLESAKWSLYEGEVLTLHQRISLVTKWAELNHEDNKPGPWELKFGLTEKASEYNKVLQKVRFMLMRQEFINDEADDNNALKRDFRFHMYLTKVMGERLGNMIELPWLQWVALEVIVMVFLACSATFAQGAWLFILAVWLVCSWGLFGITWKFYRGLQHALDRITHSCEGLSMLESDEAMEVYGHGSPKLTPKLGASDPGSEPGSGTGAGSGTEEAASEPEESATKKEDSPLLDDTAKVEIQQPGPTGRSPGGKRKWIRSRPRYLDDESLDHGQHWWVPEYMRGMPATKNTDVTRFYNLFAFGKNEGRWHLFVIRFLFLSEALFLSVFCLNVVPLYIDEAFGILPAIALTVVGTLPGFIVYFFYLYHILDASVLATSVEYFRVRRMVMAVVRHQKEDRAVMLLRIIVALHEDKPEDALLDRTLAKMETVLSDPDAQRKKKINALLETETSLELEHLADIFDNLDKDKSGSLSPDEIGMLLARFGLNTFSKEQADTGSPQVLSSLSGKKEGMTKAEFLTWMLNKAHQAEDLDAEEVAHFVFNRWDTSETGEKGKLSVEELLKGFASLGEAFTTNEVSTLVVELDLNDDGEFDHEEFELWVERHTTDSPQKGSTCCGICDY